MPEPTSAEEWAKQVVWPTECLCGDASGEPIICQFHRDLAGDFRAYARQRVEAFRERAAQALDAWAAAYPEDIWVPLTNEDRHVAGALLDRAAAQMGRHIGSIAAKDIRTLPVDNE